MTKYLISLILLFAVKLGFGCCQSHMVLVSPIENQIAQNSVFVITYMERDYKFKEVISTIQFNAVTKKGKKIPLSVRESYFGPSFTQLVLKTNKNFKIGDSIIIEPVFTQHINDTNELRFKGMIGFRKWCVTYSLDTIPPQWLEDLSATTEDHSSSSVGGQSVKINCPLTELPVICRITIDEITFLASVDIQTANFGLSICGMDYLLIQEKEYNAKVEPMDIAGNYCVEPRYITFKMPPAKRL